MQVKVCSARFWSWRLHIDKKTKQKKQVIAQHCEKPNHETFRLFKTIMFAHPIPFFNYCFLGDATSSLGHRWA